MIRARARGTAPAIVALLIALLVPAGAFAQAAGAPAAPAASAPARTYAIVSLIGDEFSVTSRRPEVGTRLDPNERKALPVSDAVFDRIAVAEVERQLLAARPGVPVLRALIRDPRLFALQDKLWSESADSHDMRIALHDLLAKAGATDLFLVTKQRGAPRIETTTGALSAGGTFSGLGFYIDNETLLYNARDKVGGEGFLAPYAYLSVSAMDVASMRLVKTVHGLETTSALPAEKGGGAHAWDALSAKEKVDALDDVIRQAIDACMPGLLAP